jgi:hypothetical protein
MTNLALPVILVAAGLAAGQRHAPSRADWIALAKGGFVVPAGRTASDLLLEMNPLLGSDDPVWRDDVDYAAAVRRIMQETPL